MESIAQTLGCYFSPTFKQDVHPSECAKGGKVVLVLARNDQVKHAPNGPFGQRPVDKRQRITGFCLTFFDNAVIPAGTPFTDHHGGQLGPIKTIPLLPARLARLTNLNKDGPEPEPIADADIVF